MGFILQEVYVKITPANHPEEALDISFDLPLKSLTQDSP